MGTLGCCGFADAAPVQWSENGHSYEVISAPVGITWEDANAAAVASGGYLATITSQEENDFVFALVDFPDYWSDPITGNRGPWLGGYQSPPTTDPSDNWQWVTAEAWGYTNWAVDQPNDLNGWVEDKLHFFVPSTGGTRASTWNDIRNSDPGGKPVAYVVEFEPVPEPSTLALLTIGLLGLGSYASRKRQSPLE